MLFFFTKYNMLATKPHRNETMTIGETSLIANLAAIVFPACPKVAIKSKIVALLNKNIENYKFSFKKFFLNLHINDNQ